MITGIEVSKYVRPEVLQRNLWAWIWKKAISPAMGVYNPVLSRGNWLIHVIPEKVHGIRSTSPKG